MSVAYRTRPTNRRTKGDIDDIRTTIQDVLSDDNPMTVRQVFYQLVSLGAIAKTETEYKHTVVRLLAEMRLSGAIPFGWIADNTRWMRKPVTDSSLEAALHRTAEAYRRSLWDTLDDYVEIWLEKDALAGVLYAVTSAWDVPLMVTRGYASLSYLYEAAAHIRAVGKPTHIYYLGDYDPSGLDIPRKVEARLREFAPTIPITFERVAVTPFQIHLWDLPTRPTKTTDSRATSFAGESVEVDAIPSTTLRDLVETRILAHADAQALATLRLAEIEERMVLDNIIHTMTGSPNGDAT